VLEVEFILLEPLSPSRRILSAPIHSPFEFGVRVLIDSNQSKIKFGVPGMGFGSSTLQWKKLLDVE
jgi:hypothetical protein